MTTTPKHRLPDGRTPVLLSTHHEDLLRVDASALLAYLDRNPAAVAAIAAHLLNTRRIRRYRIVIRAADRAELIDGLRAVAGGAEHPLVATSAVTAAQRLAFVFPGQGGQWLGMGALAYRSLPGYRDVAEMCASAFEAAGVRSPLRYLTGALAEDASPFSEIEIEGAQFTHAVALAGLWRSAGFGPDITIGHSLGEVAAAYHAGAITLEQAVLVVSARAGLVDLLPGRYAVAALAVSVDEAQALIERTDGWVELSVVNAPTSVAVAGDRDAVLTVVRAVRDTGRLAKEITVGFPVHTSALEPLRDDLRRRLSGHQFADTAVQFIGAAIGDEVAAGTAFDDYWYRNLRHQVRFDRAVEAAARRGVWSFVEMSAHPALLYATGSVLADACSAEPVVLVGSGRRDAPLPEMLSANMMTAAVADPAFGWRDLVPGAVGPQRDFPNAPMRTQHMWARAEPLPEGPRSTAVTVAAEQWTETPWPQLISSGPVAVLGRGPLAAAVRAGLQDRPGTELVVPVQAHALIVVAPDTLADPDPEAAVQALGQSVDAGLLGYAGGIGTDCRRMCLVTIGGEQTRSQDPPARPGYAALAAMHRSLGFEHPEVEFTHLDLPIGDVDPAALIDAALAGPATVALRTTAGGPILLRRNFTDSAAGAPAPYDLDEVVITGGSGAIAAGYVRELAERGARRIVLLSRRGTSPQPGVDSARHHTEVVPVRCDITDAAAVAAAAELHGASGASLVIHAAGAATFGPAGQLSSAALAHNCAAKITGLVHLTDYWPMRPQARILLCSSVSGIWGGRGHAGYAAANRMLDVLAAGLRAGGRRCTAVRWGLWDSPGTAIVDTAEVANITRSGLRPMDPAAAIAAGMAEHPVDPLVYAADAQRLQIFLADPPPVAQPMPDTGRDVSTAVRAELAAVLSVDDGGHLDLDASLFDLGIDSLLAVDLRKRLKHRLGRTVALATLLGGVTGSELVGELEQEKVDIARD